MLRSIFMALPLALGLVANASAANMTFNYLTSAGDIEVDLVGTLQPDNNSFIVSSVNGVIFNGSFHFPAGFVASADVVVFGTAAGLSGSLAALVTLDGTAMDIAICEDATCLSGFQISAANEASGFFGYSFVSASGDAGDVFETFSVTARTFTTETDALLTPVPAPGGVALFGLALFGLGLAARRKAA